MPSVTDQLNAALAGRYAVGRELGRGGMATVFLAEDLKHHRSVAIKVLDPELAAAIGAERFLREIEVAARLNHPHILPLHESGAAEGLLYYVMPYVEGESLRERLRRERQIPLDDAVRITREVADALDYAHTQGVVHRDIKPENILISRGHAVVADFGIARAIRAAGGAKLTETGLMLGTPLYMSPEQAVGDTHVDGRSDVYSLGCVLYEMLAGQPPFTGATSESVVYQHLAVAPRPVTELRPAVPEEVERAIQRTLAKAAADRFSTASEFAAAIAAPADGRPRPVSGGPRAGASEQRVNRRRAKPTWYRGRALTLAGAVVVVTLVAVAAWQRWAPFPGWLGGSSTAHPLKKEWILVAEFDGPPDDSSLAITTRDLVSAALDQSQIVACVPREQLRLALEMAGRPTNTRVDAELAKELAYRSAVRTVLEGKIGRLGQGYSVVLRVIDAESLKVVLTERAVAKNEDALIPTLGRLAQKLRASLGEQRNAIQATRSRANIATPSFEAYRLHVQARGMVISSATREAISVLKEALALDPDFAMAWSTLGTSFSNIGLPDSALAAVEEALRRPHRLTTVQRLNLEATRAQLEGDTRGAFAAYQRVLQQHDPMSSSAQINSGITLYFLGRFEEALAWFRSSQRLSPFGVTQGMWQNELYCLSALGRDDEARETTRHLKGADQLLVRAFVEIAASNWTAAESIAVVLLDDPGLDEDRRATALIYLASAQASRGALKTAAATFERTEEVARGAIASTHHRDRARRGRLMLATVSGGAIPVPAGAWDDSSTITLILHGLRAGIQGNRAAAQQVLKVVQARPRRELAWQGAGPILLEAQIEALADRWMEAARLLQPIARQPMELGYVRYPAGITAIRWFLADAFEKLGQPDSAAAYLERAVSAPAAASYSDDYLYGITWPFAHRRLVLLYLGMGRIEDAKRHWQIFAATVRTPDPELRPLIEEARAALASAEGTAKSMKR